jgi:uncharacterized protein YecE (DUF72 family)
MVKATPEEFQFSVKVPETITHRKRLDVRKAAISDFEISLDKISPLKNSNKLGAVLLQLPPGFTVIDFRKIEGFLDKLPSGYNYAVEFRHPSWKTEGPWDMLKHYNIAAVMTDSPSIENLDLLSDVTVTTPDHSFIRIHGRNTKGHYWYNYLYSKEELEPWVEKVEEVEKQARVLRAYFNNHYGGAAVINALQFKEMIGIKLSENGRNTLEHAQEYLSNRQSTLPI